MNREKLLEWIEREIFWQKRELQTIDRENDALRAHFVGALWALRRVKSHLL